MVIYLKKQTQIKVKIQVEALLYNKVSIIILIKYSNYSNIFLIKNIIDFFEYIKINDYIIKLEKSKQLFFKLIYNLGLIKLKMLKTYIKTNLVNNFIQSFKTLVKIFIFFNQKLNKSFYFYIDY